MAFNFNWSPLAADKDFYIRAQELLTNALNRNARPPIIVDDILCSELNLGDVPPELEILEIGDLAEDRFRGTFKMSYSGNAFLTLKTKVQANPLNTYLLTRPSFASPQPLAAATGLTIPLAITLSDFKLSGFIILVFSRQKGLTLVFRNDPLESLKVSSTFDSIPFVANYLQREIEGQLRILLMDELPAIIHRLSLTLFVPEHNAREEHALATTQMLEAEAVVDPLASPPQDPVDSKGNVLNPAEVASMSLDSHVETQSLFSQKNLIRLATLTDSHRTLSLFTPPIRDAVFRAWTGPLERGEFVGLHTRSATPALSRTNSYVGTSTSAYTIEGSSSTRPTLYSFPTTGSITLGAGRHGKSHNARKRKKRVINLRQKPENGEHEVAVEDGSTITDSASVTESASDSASVFSAPAITMSSSQQQIRPITPPSPESVRHGKTVERTPLRASSLEMPSANIGSFQPATDRYRPEPNEGIYSDDKDRTLRPRMMRQMQTYDIDATPRASMYLPERKENDSVPEASTSSIPVEGGPSYGRSLSPRSPLPNFLAFINDPANGGSIAEKAWMMNMASEMARRYEELREKGRSGAPFRDDDQPPPPAYVQ